jgi:hypothetical protein
VSVIEIVDKPVIISRPFLDTRAMLQVVNLRVSSLPVLQRRTLAHQPKLKGRCDEVETLQFDRFSELFSEIEADGRAGGGTEGENHELPL